MAQKEEMETTEKPKQNAAIGLILQAIVFILLLLLLRNFAIGTIIVKGSSMEPNFHHGDFVVVDKFSTTFGTLKRGDVVICKVNFRSEGENIIKRIVGLPGDKIDIMLSPDNDSEYVLYINDVLFEETYISAPMLSTGDMEYPYIVPERSYFVMGDNRNASSDSRRSSIGAIEQSNLDGRVLFRLYPFSHFGFTH